MEISVKYQGKEAYISRPETSYGSNLETFTKMLDLALLGVSLGLEGEISELNER